MAQWHPEDLDSSSRTGVVIATGVGGWNAVEKAILTTHTADPSRLSPFTVPAFLANSAAAQISIRHGFTGPIGAPVTACAAGLQALGDAARLIACHEADVVVAGGAEASLGLVTQAGFAAARSLSTRHNERPAEASRPFDADRDGFVPAEGAACLVLEAEDHALARGAKILAEWSGYGTCADAHHITSPWNDGRGAAEAMRRALLAANIAQPDLILAHATSTPLGDAAEATAIYRLIDDGAVPIAATKAATGHLLGAAGALAAVWAVCALTSGRVPPNRNLRRLDGTLPKLNYVGATPVEGTLRHALVNAFGFGGVNAAAVISRASEMHHEGPAK